MSRWTRIDGEWVAQDDDDPIVRLGASGGAGGPFVHPDWDKARTMMEQIATDPPHMEDWSEAIGVYLNDGTKLFAMHADGTVEVPFPDRLDEAAVIFFKNVVEIAQLQGFKVRNPPELPSCHEGVELGREGWDS